ERFRDADALAARLEAARASEVRAGFVRPPTLRPDEQRSVVLLYASEVSVVDALESAIREYRGAPVRLPDRRLVGLFVGGDAAGGEVARATAAAVAARRTAGRLAVSAGRATADEHGIRGTAVDAAEAALARTPSGIGISAEAARELSTLDHQLSEVGGGLLALEPDDGTLARLLHAPVLTPFVGRELELARVSAALRAANDEPRGEALFVIGEAGIGKTRLLDEALVMLEEDSADARVLAGRLDAIAGGRELGLWVSLLEGAVESLGSEVTDDPAWTLARMAADDDASVARLATELASLVGAPAERPSASAPTEIQLLDDRRRVAIAEWVIGMASQGSLVLRLENAHRADARSIDLLEEILEQARELPLVALATARPEMLDPGRAHPFVVSSNPIVLRGLGRAAASSLIDACSDAPLPEALRERIAQRTEGNPLFIEHVVRSLDPASPESVPGEIPLPHSVEAALQARLDTLAPSEREVCKTASVFGRPFAVDELEAVGAGDAAPSILTLRRRGLLLKRGREQHDFASALLRDVAYRLLSEARRTELHALAAECFAARGVDPEETARHFELAGNQEDAARMFARAASAAARRGDVATILRASSRALVLSPAAAESYELRMARAEALRFRGSRDAQHIELQAALALAGDPRELALVHSELCVHQSRAGDADRALEAGRAAVRAAELAGDAGARVLAEGRLALAHLAAGAHDDAAAALARAEAAAAGAVGAEPMWAALLAEWRGQLAAARGELAERMRAFADAASLHRARGDLRRAAGADTNRADVLNRLGKYEDAERALTLAVDACRKVGHRAMEGYARVNLAYALLQRGRPADALVQLHVVGAIATRLHERRLRVYADTYSAAAELARGDADRSLTLAEGAAAEAEAAGFRAALAAARVREAEALERLGRLVESHRTIASARAIAEELGGLEEDEALLYTVAARVARTLGLHDEARAAIERGAARLREQAAGLGDEGRAFLDDVPAHRALLDLERGSGRD
ncbi:MAG: AAA family ATPase, partial [Sandaracinaceae bacterium]